MHDIGEGTIRKIDWQELVPAVLLLRIFNAALSLRVLCLALVGLALSLVLISQSLVLISSADLMHQKVQVPSLGILPERTNESFIKLLQKPVLVLPTLFYELGCETSSGNLESFLVLFGNLVIWIFFGGLICRTVAVRLTIDERESVKMQRTFLWKRGWGFVSFFIILGMGILCCLLPIIVAVRLAAFWENNVLLWILMPFAFLFSFFALVLAVGLVFGFPLLFSAVAVEGADGFDAVSRMFSYLYQRPLHYVLYWVYAAVLGLAGYAAVTFFCIGTLQLTALFYPPIDFQSPLMFWVGLCSLIPKAYCCGWFWTSSVAVYLLLRRSVDATPFDDVYRVKKPEPRQLSKIDIPPMPSAE